MRDGPCTAFHLLQQMWFLLHGPNILALTDVWYTTGVVTTHNACMFHACAGDALVLVLLGRSVLFVDCGGMFMGLNVI